MSRLTRSILLLAAGALALSACSSSDDSDGATTPADETTSGSASITLALSSSPSATALKEIAKSFEAETGIKVNVVDLTYDQIGTKVLLAAQQANATYDVVQFDSPMLAAFAAGNALAPLDDYLANSPTYDYDDFPDQVKDYARYHDVSYGIPLSTEPYILWTNTTLLSETGQSVPTTLDEYTAVATALNDAGYYGSDSGYGTKNGGYYWLEAVYMNGGALLSDDGCSSALDTDAVREVTQWYLDLAPYTPATALNGGGNEMTTAFVQGDVGQMVNATGYYSIMNDPEQSQIPGDFAANLPPAGADGQHTLMFGWLIGITENSSVKDEAWQFLEYALGKDSMETLISEGAPPPARTSLTESAQVREELPYVDILVEASAFGEHLPYVPETTEIITSLSQLLSDATTGNWTGDQLVDKANTEVNRIMSTADSCG